MTLNMPQTDKTKEFIGFLSSLITKVADIHGIKIESLATSINFIDKEHYGEEIRKIDKNETYTDDGHSLGCGKAIFHDNKNFIIINSDIFYALTNSNFKSPLPKYLILHELGHCANRRIRSFALLPQKPLGKQSVSIVSKYTFLVAIDEYFANSNIISLLSEDECKDIIVNNSLNKNIFNMFNKITTQFDIFGRMWNNTDAIFKTFLQDLPLFQKAGFIPDMEKLEPINYPQILNLLDQYDYPFDNLYEYLINCYNSILNDYNSNIPNVVQRGLLWSQKK
jgi:hypothetical protein